MARVPLALVASGAFVLAEVTTLDPETLTSPATPEAVADPAVPVEPVDPDAPAVEPGNEPSDEPEEPDEPDERTIEDMEEDWLADKPLLPSEVRQLQEEFTRRQQAQQQQQEMRNLLPNTSQRLIDELGKFVNLSDPRDAVLIKQVFDSVLFSGNGSVQSMLQSALVQPHADTLGAQLQSKLVESGMSNREANKIVFGDGANAGIDLYEMVDKAYEAGKRNGVSDKEVAKREKAAADARERELFAKYPDRFPAKPEDGRTGGGGRYSTLSELTAARADGKFPDDRAFLAEQNRLLGIKE